MEPEIEPLNPVRNVSFKQSYSSSSPLHADYIGILSASFQSRAEYGQRYLAAAKTHQGKCRRVVREMDLQMTALQVALTNLDAHGKSVTDAFEVFQNYTSKELSRQAILLDAYPMLLKVLNRINVHPALLNKRKGNVALAEFVAEDKMQAVVKQCTVIHDDFVNRIDLLSGTIKDINEGTQILRNHSPAVDFVEMDDTIAQVQAHLDKVQHLTAMLERDLARVQDKLGSIRPNSAGNLSGQGEKTLEAIEHLDSIHLKEYLPDLVSSDRAIRDKVLFLVSAKSRLASDITACLREISRLQSSIAIIPSSITELDSGLSSKSSDFKHLTHLHQMPLAYVATVVEIVRRKEYAKLLGAKAIQLAEAMSRFRNTEQKRRETFRTDVKKYVPIDFSGLEDSPAFVEVSTINITDVLPDVSRDDLEALVGLLHHLQMDVRADTSPSPKTGNYMTGSQGSSSVRSDVFAALQQAVHKLQNQLDHLPADFERVFDRYVLGGRTSGRQITSPVPQTLSRLGSLTDRRRSADPSAADFEAALIAKVAQLERSEDTVRSLNARITELENNNRELLRSKEELRDTNEVNEGRLEAFQRELDDVRQHLAEATSRQREVETRNGELEDHFLDFEEHRDRFEELEKELTEAKRMLEEKWEENSGLATRNEELQQALEETQEVARERDAVLEELENHLSNHRQESEDWRDREHQFSSQIHELENLLEEAKGIAAQDVTKVRAEMQAKYDNLATERDQNATREREQFESDLKKVKADSVKHENTAASIKKLLSEARAFTEKIEREWKEQREQLYQQQHLAEAQSKTIDERLVTMLTTLGGDKSGDSLAKLAQLDVLLRQKGAESNADDERKQLLDARSAKARDLSQRLYTYFDRNQSLLIALGKPIKSTSKSGGLSPSSSIHLPAALANDPTLLHWQANTVDVTGGSTEDEKYAQFHEMINAFDLDAFADSIKHRVKEAETTVKKWQRECKNYRDKAAKSSQEASEKIAFRNFAIGDLALFLPTRNNAGERPWAAFNINFPHYFLSQTEGLTKQLKSREWIVARITGITEKVVDIRQPVTNPYGLGDGVKYNLLEVESLRDSPRKSKSKMSMSTSSVAGKKEHSSAGPSKLSKSMVIGEDGETSSGSPERKNDEFKAPEAEAEVGNANLAKAVDESHPNAGKASTTTPTRSQPEAHISPSTDFDVENEMSAAISSNVGTSRSPPLRHGRPISMPTGSHSRSSSRASRNSAVTTASITSPLGRSPSKALATTQDHTVPVEIRQSQQGNETVIRGPSASPSESILRRMEQRPVPTQSNLSKALKGKESVGNTPNGTPSTSSWFKRSDATK